MNGGESGIFWTFLLGFLLELESPLPLKRRKRGEEWGKKKLRGAWDFEFKILRGIWTLSIARRCRWAWVGLDLVRPEKPIMTG